MSKVVDHPHRKDRFKAFGWIDLSVEDIESNEAKMADIYEEIDRQACFLNRYVRSGQSDEVRAQVFGILLRAAIRFGRPDLTDPLIKRFGYSEADRAYLFKTRPQFMNRLYGSAKCPTDQSN